MCLLLLCSQFRRKVQTAWQKMWLSKGGCWTRARPVTPGLVTHPKCLWALILLKHSPGIHLYDMANKLNYINLNLKHLPSKYNSLQYSSGKKPKEDGEDREMAHGTQKTTSARVNPWEVNEIISLLSFHLAFSPVLGFLFGRQQSLFSPTFYSFGKCDKGYFSIIF